MYSLTVDFAVRLGLAELWLSEPTSGYFDAQRFPERLLCRLNSGQAFSTTVTVPSLEAAITLRPHSASVWPVAFLLSIALGPEAVMSLEAISYRHDERTGVIHNTRHRLRSVAPIARVGAFKITPSHFQPSDRTLSFRGALPSGATLV